MRAGQPYPGFPTALPLAAVIASLLWVQACGSTSVTDVAGPGPVRCAASITMEPTSIPADGGGATVSVTAARDCTWSAQSEASWLQLTTTSGQGTATIAVAAGVNAQATSRTGNILVNDQRISVIQDGRGCNISLTGPAGAVASTGGQGTLRVSTLGGCAWTVTSSASWLVPGVPSGSGTADVPYQVQSNSGGVREATLTVGTQAFVVSQAAAPAAPPCSYTIDRATQDIAAAGGQATVLVSTQSGCAWTVTGGAPWIAIDTSQGTGSGTARYTVAPNGSLSGRQATLTIAGRVHTVMQQPVVCDITIAPPAQTFPATGGTGVIQVTTLAVCPWTATTNAGWTTVSTSSGIGSGQVTYQVAANTTQSLRSAIVTVGGQQHAVTQNAAPVPCTYDLDPASRTFTDAAISSTVRVNTQSGCAWTAVSSDSWIVVSPTTVNGSGSTDIGYALAANTLTTSRSGTITIAGRQHTITQQGVTPPCTYVLSPAESTLPPSGGTATVKVTTGPTCAWTAVSNAGFVTVLTPSGTGTFDIQYQLASGPPSTNRMATITVNGQVHTVRQRMLP